MFDGWRAEFLDDEVVYSRMCNRICKTNSHMITTDAMHRLFKPPHIRSAPPIPVKERYAENDQSGSW